MSGRRGELAAAAFVAAVVIAVGLLLGAWTGFPKGVDAYQHLTRLKFVSEWFPHHDWFYAWAAGMPMFDNYPGLPYVASLPLVRLFGEVWTLEFLALLAMLAFGLGFYGHVRLRSGDLRTAILATVMVMTSMAIWYFITASGVYARVVAMGFGALAWWAHAKALERRSGRWWAFTAVLIAATIASHPVTGAFVAGYITIVQLTSSGIRGMKALVALGSLSFLLAAQPIASSLGFGLGGTILGVDRPGLLHSQPVQLVGPQFIGLAAFSMPAIVVLLQLPRRFWRAIGAAAGLLAVLGYMFAPNLGVPTRYYYINGIDPATTTYFLAIVGGLAFAALAPSLATRTRRLVYGLAAALIAVNAVLAIPAAYAANYVNDTSSPNAAEQIALRSLVVDGDDLRHRIAPLTATESVLFNYFHRKPELRDYYAFAQLNVDWLYWAYDTLYHPPINRARYQAVLDWYALDAITVSVIDDKGEGDIAALDFMRLAPETRDTPFRLYRYLSPSAIAALTSAPIVVVVGDRSDYDMVARLLFDEGASPRTRVPVWWSGRFADLPPDLAARAASVVIVGDRLGEQAAARERAEALAAAGARVLWDVGNLQEVALPAPWPVTRLERASFDRWAVMDRAGRIAESDFSPASYEGGPWSAAIPAATADGATVELSLGSKPLIVSVSRSSGALTIVGGNLLYHAQSKANATERRYLLSYLAAPASGAETDVAWRFVHPQRREIETDGRPVLLKESIYSKWSARLIAADGSARPLRVEYAGPGLMLALPPAPGTVVFEYSSTTTLGWSAWALTVLGIAFALVLASRRQAFVPPPPRPPDEDDDLDE